MNKLVSKKIKETKPQPPQKNVFNITLVGGHGYSEFKLLSIVKYSAKKFLKLRTTKSGDVSVTITDFDIDGKVVKASVRIPLDTRYKQSQEAVVNFYNSFATEAHNIFEITRGDIQPSWLSVI